MLPPSRKASGETRAIAGHLDMRVGTFKRKHTFVDEDGWRQLRFAEGRCTFLSPDGRCGIYEVRPVQCRTFPFWPEFMDGGEWTDEVRELCEGIGQGPRYTEQEADERMLEFMNSEKD